MHMHALSSRGTNLQNMILAELSTVGFGACVALGGVPWGQASPVSAVALPLAVSPSGVACLGPRGAIWPMVSSTYSCRVKSYK